MSEFVKAPVAVVVVVVYADSCMMFACVVISVSQMCSPCTMLLVFQVNTTVQAEPPPDEPTVMKPVTLLEPVPIVATQPEPETAIAGAEPSPTNP